MNTQHTIEGDYKEVPIPTTDLELIPTIYQEPDEGIYYDVPVEKRNHLLPLVVGCSLLSVILASLVMFVIYPLFFERTTITLYAQKQTVQQDATLSIPLRTLMPVQQVAHKTVQTTGVVTRSATPAHGLIDFYNSALVAQTIPAGTELFIGNVQVVTDETVTIAAGTLATNGSASVPAHTLSTGISSNLAAGVFVGACCRENIKATNHAFWGGADPVSYHTLTHQDITDTATTLVSGLEPLAQKALLAQVQNTETLLPQGCTLATTSDVPVGAIASTVTITETENCTGHTYNTHDVQTQANQLLAAKAGSMYQAEGDVETQVKQSVQRNTTLTLQVALSGVYTYTLSPADTLKLKKLLSGKHLQDANVQLLEMQGITQVQIHGVNSFTNTLPDTSRIDILTQ